MNLVRCEKGHFYDQDKFSSCPHCSSSEDDRSVTMVIREDKPAPESDNTIFTEGFTGGVEQPERMSLKDAIETVGKANSQDNIEDADDDMGKTISYYSKAIGTDPVVGWLIAINGNHFGQGFLLKSGRNFIGRANDMDIRLEGDESVSRNKHAIVVYEPKSRMFIAQPGESKELFYVNDKVVLNNEQLKKNDVLTLGKTKLMLIPCCDENFCWEDVENEK